VPLRASVALSSVVSLIAVAILGTIARAGLPVGALYPVKAATVLALVMIVANSLVRAHHPFARFGPANQLTTVRAVLVALVTALIGEPAVPLVAAAATVAALIVTGLDGVDGWLARTSGIASEFGARFDMEIDALLIMALAILAWQHGKAGGWVLLSGLLRYAFVVAGWLAPWLARPLPPSRRRQTICVVQIVGLCLATAPIVRTPFSTIAAATALAALVGSFLVDIVWLWRLATPTTIRARAFPSSS
jgi:phosphatidylglycerophosphate synthase